MLSFFKLMVWKILPDRLCIKYLFYHRCGYKLNLENPKTFNEKIQWLKLYNRNPDYTNMVDKWEAKKYVAKIIGKKHIIPSLGIYNTFDEIDFDKLPKQFVLKCTHDSGGVIICKDKDNFDIGKAKDIMNNGLKINRYDYQKEWAYKNVKPRIIVEKYMVDESGVELKDYKVFCFNGEPKMIQVDFGRFTNHKRNIYDLQWNLLPFEILYPSDKNYKIEKPICLKEMLVLAKRLSNNIPHVRIDFYVIGNDIYFGEMTFYHGSGFEDFRPKKRDYKFGEWIKLPSEFISK